MVAIDSHQFFRRNTSVSDLQLIDGRFYSLMTVLTKELSQSNLQVLKEALSCVDDFMNCWRNYTPWGEHIRTPHLTPSELTLLLVSLIQLLRHSNRAIITSSMELLRKWFEMDASDSPDKLKLTHGARFLVLVSLHFQEAVKAKPTGIDLLLHWFVEILTLTGQRWCQFRTTSALLFILESSERQEELISRFIQMLSPLLRHKDEKTRDASLLALGHVCSLDLFWYRHVSNPTASPSLVTIPNSFSELLDQLPPVTAQYMREISTDSSWKRSEGKFLQAVNSFMRKLETL